MSSSDGEKWVLYRRAPAGLPRARLESFAHLLSDEIASGQPFCCLVTNDAAIRRLNKAFRGLDYPTDVLSFPSEPLGEMAISADRAHEQATEHGHSVEEEICILMLHGLLHLLGMDHETDRGRMRRAEADWRERLGLPAGLIERTAGRQAPTRLCK